MAKGLGIRTHQVGLGESIEQAAKRISRRGLVVKVRASDFTQPLGRMSAKANEFTKSLEASNARVIAFGASAAIIGGITTSFVQLVVQAAKFEKILTDINVVLGATNDNLNKFGDGLANVARNTSQSLEVAAEAALEFSRQGLSMEETLKRTNDALILTRLTGMKAADAVKGLTAAVNGFGDVGLTTSDIINKLAAVDVKFAVSADDLVNALSRAGAVAQDAGVQFDQLIGAVTAAQQITARGGAVIGNSFKTIFTRVQRSSTISRLEELGIAVRDIRGNTLPALTVLKNLSSAYDTLGASTKAAVAEQVGGVFQVNILKAAIKDLNKETSLYSQATEVSANATDQAYEKNAILQKSLSSIAIQTLTTVRELTANLGELTIAPALKNFLGGANDMLSMFNEVFGEGKGESIGGTFAKGFARAVGSVLTGPGMFLAILVFGKLFSKAFKFAKDSIKDLLEIQNIKDKERMIQESIVDAMTMNVDLQKKLNQLDGDHVAQEALVLKMLKEQTAFLEKQRSIAKSIAPGLRTSGVQSNLTVGAKPSKSEGFIPNFSQVTPMDKQREREGAKKGGYVAGAISTMNIPNLGEVVYNKNESVKKFSGMRQPAIMPPEKSRAGSQYKDSFKEKHGFNPYVSGGLIPNYALEARRVGNTNILKLPKAKMMVETSAKQKLGGNRFGGKVTGWKTLEARVEALQAKGMAWYKDSLEDLKSLGIDVIQRPFYFTNIDHQKKASKKASRAQSKIPKKGFTIGSDGKKMTKSDVGGSVFEDALLKSSHQSILKDRKYKSTKLLKGATVDFISKGKLPIEAKHGSTDFQENSLMAKSLRLTGDKYIEQFLRKHGKEGSAASMAQTKMKESMNVLEKNKIKPSEENVALYRLANGLIPNFIDDKVPPVKSISNIIDGDSIEADVLIGSQRIDHRLHGVDAVEKDQAFGTRATSIAKNFYDNRQGKKRLRDRRVQRGKAAYGRGLFKDQELARSLVEKGYGIPDAGYLNKGDYIKYQKIAETAKSKGVGIWRDRTPKTKKYRHPKAKFYLHQQGIIQDAENWKGVTVGKTRLRDKRNINLSNKKFEGYADGGRRFKSPGLIPNFADPRSRQQKIQDVLKDPANKGIKFRGSKLGTMSIKSKNMFHQMFLESYVNKGLKSDYDMLVDMGYDPQKINAARKHKQKGGKVRITSKGFIPNFMTTSDFNTTSTSLSSFNRDNVMDLKTALSGGKGFKLTKYNFEKVRQFLNSSSFRSLPFDIQDKLIKKLKLKSRILKMGDVTRPYLKGDTSFRGRIAASSGLIPNFSNPLLEAIDREKSAGIPESRIRVDSSKELISADNPMGLAVTNTRDEPLGVQQGIQRAKEMGIDPKTHGASIGYLPNFATKAQIRAQGDDSFAAGVGDLGKSSQEASKEVGKHGDSSGKAAKSGMDVMGAMFALTTVTYAVEGALGDAENTFAKVTKTVNATVMGFSQAGMIFSSMKDVGDNVSKGGGKFSKVLGGAVKGLGAVGAAVGLAIPVFNALKENTTWFDSSMDTLRKSTEKTAKAMEGLSGAIEATKGLQETQRAITELNNSGQKNTYEGKRKEIQLQTDLFNKQMALTQAASTLSGTIDVTAEEFKLMTSGTAAGMKALEEAMLRVAKTQSANENSKNIQSALDSITSYFSSDSTDQANWMKGSREAMLNEMEPEERSKFEHGTISLTQQAFGSSKTSAEENAKVLQNLLNSKAKEGIHEQGYFDKTNMPAGYDSSYIEGTVSAYHDDASKIALLEQVKLIEKTHPELKAQIDGFAKGKMNTNLIKIKLREMLHHQSDIAATSKEQKAAQEIELMNINKINKHRAEIQNAMALQSQMAKNNLNLSIQGQQHEIDKLEYQRKISESLGILSESTLADEKIAIESQRINNAFNNKKEEANNKAIEAQHAFINKQFLDNDQLIGTNFATLRQGLKGPAGEGTISGSNLTEIAEAGSDEAIAGNLKNLQALLLNAGMERLAADLKGVKSAEDASSITADYLKNIKDSDKLNKTLLQLEKLKVIDNTDLSNILKGILDSKGEEERVARETKKKSEANLDTLRKDFLFSKNGLSVAKERTKKFREIVDKLGGSLALEAEIQKGMNEDVQAVIESGKVSQLVNHAKREHLNSLDYTKKLTDSMNTTLDDRLTSELESLAKKRAELDAEDKSLKLKQLAAKVIRENIKNEQKEMRKKGRDLKTTSEAKHDKVDGKTFFESESTLSLTELQTSADDLKAQFEADLSAGVHTQQSLLEMSNSAREFAKSMNNSALKLSKGEFEKEGQRSSILGRMETEGKKQTSQSLDKKITEKDFQNISLAGKDGAVSPEMQKLKESMIGMTGAQVNAASSVIDFNRQTQDTIIQSKANTEAMVHEAEARLEMAQEAESYTKTLANIKERLRENDFAKKALESIVTEGANIEGETQGIKGKSNVITDSSSSLFGMTGFVGESENKIKTMNNSIDDLTGGFEANKKTQFYQTEATLNYRTALIEGEEAQIKFTEALKTGQFELEAVNEMAEASREFTKSMIKAREKLDAMESYREGQRDVQRGQISAEQKLQRATGSFDAHKASGNQYMAAESELEVAKAQKEYNLQMNEGTLFMDTMKVKIAEANLETQKFGETLANTTFDAVKGGFRDLMDNMVDGTKSSSDAIMGFVGGIAKKISDAFMDKAINQLTAGIMESFMPGQSSAQMNNGGIVSRYSSGGSTRSVPAMLTAGEVVVRKKVVDRLGKSSLDKINQEGSLDDLYNKPNEDSFSLLNEGGSVSPPIARFENQGSLDNYLARKNPGDDRVSQNERSTVNGEVINDFTNTLARFMGGIVHLNKGGSSEDKKGKGLSRANANILEGGGYAIGALGANFLNKKDNKKDNGPEAPIRQKRMNTQSMLSLDEQDERMSGRSRSTNQYRQDYGKYLLDKYEHDIQKKNEKEKQKAGLIQSLASIAVIGGTAAVGKKMGVDKLFKGSDTQSAIASADQVNSHSGSQGMEDRQSVSNSFKSTANSQTSSIKGGSMNHKQLTTISSMSNSSNNSFGGDYSYNNQLGQYKTTNSQNHGITNNLNSHLYEYNKNSIFRNKGGQVNGIAKMSSGGKVFGPGGIDKVGPVMLDRGEYVIKASSVNKVEKEYPGFFDKLNSSKMNKGGVVEDISTPKVEKTESSTSNTNSSNVTVNINIAPGGATSIDGGDGSQQAFAGKIKEAVVAVISQEKRVGGMLSGN